MKFGKWIVAAALTAPFFASPVLADDEKPDMKASDDQGTKVELKDVPPAVAKTLREQSQNKTLGDIHKLTVMGKTMYRAEITSGGKSQMIDISEAGKVMGKKDKMGDKAQDKTQDKQAPKGDADSDMDHK